MDDLVTYINTKYNTKSCYEVEVDDNCNATCSKKVNTTFFGLQTFSWLGLRTWALIHDDL